MHSPRAVVAAALLACNPPAPHRAPHGAPLGAVAPLPAVPVVTPTAAAAARSPAPVAAPRVQGLGTGTDYRFKGLAIDRATARAYLASWDRKQLVVVDLERGTHHELPTPYAGRLAVLGVHVRDGALYAVLNQIDGGVATPAISALVVIDVATEALVRAFELHARGPRHHFNHVVVAADGTAYVSDTLHATIHAVDTRDPAASFGPLVVDARLGRVHGVALSRAAPRLFATAYDGGLSIYDLEHHTFLGEPFAASAGDDGLAYARGGLYGIGRERLTHYALDPTESEVIDASVVLLEHPSFNDPRDVWVEDDRITCLANMELAPASPHRRGRPATDTNLLEILLPQGG